MIKRKILGVLCVLLSLFLFIENVSADADYTYRTKRENKPVVTVGNVKLYVSASVLFNIEGGFSSVKVPVENISARYENNGLYVSVKRSEINKVLRNNKYDNVYELLEVNADFLDLNPNKKYYYFKQNDSTSLDGQNYNYYTADSDYYVRNYNFLEISSSSLPLAGLSMNDRESIGGGFMLYEADNLPDYSSDIKYNKQDINSSDNLLIDMSKDRVYVSLIEDEQIDLGENTNIVGATGTFNEETNEMIHDSVDINNFYGEYFENNKLKYSWTLYDESGNPVELDINTKIKIDESENEDVILSNFNDEIDNIKDRIKIISFEHEGELGGVANVSLYVGDKFKPGSILSLYYFNPEKGALEDIENAEGVKIDIEKDHDKYNVLVDEDGYISIKLTHCSEYVLTESNIIPNSITETIEKNNDTNNNYILYGSLVILFVVIVVTILIVSKKKKHKKANNEIKDQEKLENYKN